MVQSRMDITRIIKNSGQIDVLKNVFLKDYQIKLIPHLTHDDSEESEKAKDLTNEEALDILMSKKVEGANPVDLFILQHIDQKFYAKYNKNPAT